MRAPSQRSPLPHPCAASPPQPQPREHHERQGQGGQEHTAGAEDPAARTRRRSSWGQYSNVSRGCVSFLTACAARHGSAKKEGGRGPAWEAAAPAPDAAACSDPARGVCTSARARARLSSAAEQQLFGPFVNAVADRLCCSGWLYLVGGAGLTGSRSPWLLTRRPGCRLQEAGVPIKLARSIGVSVDHRRRNRSLEGLQVCPKAQSLCHLGPMSHASDTPFWAWR